MADVVFERVGKTYPDGTVGVRGLDLEISDGEFVCLVGPSGCGKSTTLNLLAGLEEITSGELRISGQRANERSPRERDVAMVFQSYALYPHLSVRENLAFPLKVVKTPAAERDAKVTEAAERLGLTALLDKKPRELSGGQRQRVALGRALVRRPSLFLFDEPLSNLDPNLRGQMRAEIKKLHEALRTTFVYVTHDQAEAMTLADRVVVMRAGEKVQVGPPRELYDRPASRFVAEFFGSPPINLVPPGVLGIAAAPERAIAGVRPEHLELGLGAPAPGAAAGSIYLVEPLGAESLVTVAIGKRRVVARAAPDFEAPVGAPAWVRPHPGKVLFFADDPSGARIG